MLDLSCFVYLYLSKIKTGLSEASQGIGAWPLPHTHDTVHPPLLQPTVQLRPTRYAPIMLFAPKLSAPGAHVIG